MRRPTSLRPSIHTIKQCTRSYTVCCVCAYMQPRRVVIHKWTCGSPPMCHVHILRLRRRPSCVSRRTKSEAHGFLNAVVRSQLLGTQEVLNVGWLEETALRVAARVGAPRLPLRPPPPHAAHDHLVCRGQKWRGARRLVGSAQALLASSGRNCGDIDDARQRGERPRHGEPLRAALVAPRELRHRVRGREARPSPP